MTHAARFLLMICLASAAVQGCTQRSPVANPSTAECPDLTGTYQPRNTEWIDKFWVASAPRPKGQAPQFATFQKNGSGYTLIWHMQRPEFLAAARLQAERDPRKYGIWLDMVLRDPSAPLLGTSAQEWSNRMANYGPVFRFDTEMPIKRCKGGWFLISAGVRTGPADIEGGMDGTREVELSLGRDTDGSLSMRWREYRAITVIQQTRYSSYFGIPLWWSTHLDKWPTAPAPDLTPIGAEELPEGKRPSSRIPKCLITNDHEALFFQRLKANMPPGVEIQNRSQSIYHGRLRPDGTCDPTAYSLTVSAPNAASVAKLADYLRTDPLIRKIESQETVSQGPESLWVKFKMMAAP